MVQQVNKQWLAGKVDKQWFTNKIQDKKISQRQLAGRIDIDPSALSLILSGKRKLGMLEAARISDELGAPIEQVLNRAGIEMPNQGTTVPVVGMVNGSGRVTMGKVEGEKLAPMPPGLSTEAKALRMHNGWTLYYVPGSRVDAEAVGSVSVAGTVDGEIIVGCLKRASSPGKWNLEGFFGEGVNTARLEWASRVEWIKM